jgi:hypothetical protein
MSISRRASASLWPQALNSGPFAAERAGAEAQRRHAQALTIRVADIP